MLLSLPKIVGFHYSDNICPLSDNLETNSIRIPGIFFTNLQKIKFKKVQYSIMSLQAEQLRGRRGHSRGLCDTL
jgi:hypothetical protein